MTACKGSTGAGCRWTVPWARRRSAGKKTGRNPTDRGKLGSKRSLLTDGRGGPLSVVVAFRAWPKPSAGGRRCRATPRAGANRNDHKLMRETLQSLAAARPLALSPKALAAAVPSERREPVPSGKAPQHLCLDKGYDYQEPRDLAVEFGFTLHLRTRGEEINA